MDWLLPDGDVKWLLYWPPDLFALTSLVLEYSDSYRLAVSHPRGFVFPPEETPDREKTYGAGGASKWPGLVAENGSKWRREIENLSESNDYVLQRLAGASEVKTPDGIPNVPDLVRQYWNWLEPFLDGREDLDSLTGDRGAFAPEQIRFCTAVLALHSLADEACANLIVRSQADERMTQINLAAMNRLRLKGTLATIDPSRIRVLPKLHTPRPGISLRSLSHHLAVARGGVDIQFSSRRWESSPDASTGRTLNCLLLPWPLQLTSQNFRPCPQTSLRMPDRFRLFDYVPDKDAIARTLRSELGYVIGQAKSHVGRVDLVVLPELSLPAELIPLLEEILAREQISMYLAGVHDAPGPPDRTRPGANYLLFRKQTPRVPQPRSGDRFPFEAKQYKHHRWLLDRHQIVQYQLGAALHPSFSWWENITLPKRSLHFVAITPNLLACPLLCEDLARPDPVAEIIRSVGPSLVIVLLMDGPQKRERWSARYATVLADDPGCSVLTLTSLGMAELSRPAGKPASRVMALWKDSQSEAEEIELAKGQIAVVLSLCAMPRLEHTADGRVDCGQTDDLILAGKHYIELPPRQAAGARPAMGGTPSTRFAGRRRGSEGG